MAAGRPPSVRPGVALGVGLLLAVGLHAACSDRGDDPPAAGAAERHVRLLLAGDVMLARGIDQIQRHAVDPVLYERYVRSARDYVALAERTSGAIPRDVEPAYVWGDALAAIESFAPAARVVNLECAVTTHPEPWPDKGIQYRTHPANVAVLRAAGIDCAVLANNHALDWRRPGLRETLRALHEAGIAVAGAGEDLRAAAAPAAIPCDGGRVLVFAAAHGSSGVAEAWAAAEGRSGVHRLADLSVRTARTLATTIRGTRRPGDLVVVSIHWGGNWGHGVPAEQRAFARTLIDEGAADVVHGHSSHHPKGLEVHRSRLILYGAGDLINDYEGIRGHEAFRPGLVLLYLPRLAPDGRLREVTMLPFRIERFRLREASAEERSWLGDLLRRESRGLTVSERDGALAGVHAEE